MPSVPLHRAIATRDSIANLWHMAERVGEVTILLHDQRACVITRNKLYAHRSRLRKSMAATVGTYASHLDEFTFSFEQSVTHHPKWEFKITKEIFIEFELIVPEDWEGPLPNFDTPEDNMRYDDSTGEWFYPESQDDSYLPPELHDEL